MKSLAWHMQSIHLNMALLWLGFPGGSDVKASACNAGDPGSIPRSERSPGEGNGNPLQYSCLKNSMDRGAWEATYSPPGRRESDKTEQLHFHLLYYGWFPMWKQTFLIFSHNFKRSICKYYQENKLHLPFRYFLFKFKLYEQGRCQVTKGWVSGKGRRKIEKNGSQIVFEGTSYNLQHSCNSFNCLTWARTEMEASRAKIQYAWDDTVRGCG